MKKFAIQVIALTLVAIISFYVTFSGNNSLPTLLGSNAPTAEKKQLVVGEDVTLKVEVADTKEKRQIGLSGRDALAENEGMLFVFPETSKYQFWMKNMKFPIDFVFIRDGQVVDFIKNARHPAVNTADSELTIYQPLEEINMLLEVNAGFVDNNNLKIGDEVVLVENGETVN